MGYRYSKRFKMACIRLGECTIGDAAKKRNVPKQTIARWIKLYEQNGHEGLENKKPGAREKPINPAIEKEVLESWNQKKRSAYRMLRDLGKKHSQEKDFKISKREVYKIYKKHRLIFKK